jgi:Spy/CpxP family protein refolding chaperone
MKSALRCLLLALALLAPSSARADTAPEPTPDQKRAQVEARMRQIRLDILQKEVGLGADKTRVVAALLERHGAERKKLEGALQNERRAVERLLQADSNDQAAYAKALRAVRARRAQLAALRERELDEIGRHLTPKQQAKFLSALRRTHKKLRALLHDYSGSDRP